MVFIDGVAFGAHIHDIGKKLRSLGEGMATVFDMEGSVEFLSQVIGRKNKSAARVLLLGASEQVCCKADLSFDLLFAVAEVIVGNDRHDDAALVASGELEGGAVVVEFGLSPPAHAVTALALGGGLPFR